MDVISVLADISLILVAVEFMLLAAIPLAAIYFAARGMHWLNTNLRLGLRRVLSGVNKTRDAVGRGAQLVVRPFVAVSVYAAQARGLLRGAGKTLSGRS